MRTLMLLTSGLCVFAASVYAADKNIVKSAQDREWITLSGKVTSVAGETFQLSHGDGKMLTVEMDDYDWYNENVLKVGEQVTVTGKIDKNLFDKKTLEASSVYVDQRKTHYFANAADEEGGFFTFYSVQSIPMQSKFASARDEEWIGLTGKIRARDGDVLSLDSSGEMVKVDLDNVPYDVTAKVGDRVRVYGEVDNADLFEGAELQASSVVVLNR